MTRKVHAVVKKARDIQRPVSINPVYKQMPRLVASPADVKRPGIPVQLGPGTRSRIVRVHTDGLQGQTDQLEILIMFSLTEFYVRPLKRALDVLPCQ